MGNNQQVRMEGGKRVHSGDFLTSSESRPVISVITVVFNRLDDLSITLPSVVKQSYTNVEYIIIDGGSSDGTLELIQQYDKQISYWLSEEDDGLYGAMNKGLDLATGNYVWFMNAGDEIFSRETIDQLTKKLNGLPDVIYGETMLIDSERNEFGTRSDITTQKLPKHLHWKSLNKGMVVCHQSILVKRSIAPTYIHDHFYSADIDWVIKALKKSEATFNANMILSRYLMGGFSKENHKKSLWDRYDILRKHYGFFPNLASHVVIVIRALFGSAKY